MYVSVWSQICNYVNVEICLLFKCRRVAHVRAVTVCELYSLDKHDFDTILNEYPRMKHTMHNIAEERLAHLKDTYGPGWIESQQSHTDYSPAELRKTSLRADCMPTRPSTTSTSGVRLSITTEPDLTDSGDVV